MPSFHARKKPPRSFTIPRKALSKFPTAPHTEVFTRPNKPFKFPHLPKRTPKFRNSAKPRFPPIQNDLLKFLCARPHPRFPHIHISTHITPEKCTFKVSECAIIHPKHDPPPESLTSSPKRHKASRAPQSVLGFHTDHQRPHAHTPPTHPNTAHKRLKTAFWVSI